MDTPEAVQPSENAPGGVATPAAGSYEDCRHWFRTPDAGMGPGCQACGFALLHPIHRRECFRCAKPLKPTQHRWCSRKCSAAHHDALHPRINPPGLGLRDQGSIKERIRKHLLGLEGKHATAFDIAAAIQEHESTTHRELRKLRKRGCPIQTGTPNGHRKPAVFWIPKGAA